MAKSKPTKKPASPDAAPPVEQVEKPAAGVKCPRCGMVGLWHNSTSEEAGGAVYYCSGCREDITKMLQAGTPKHSTGGKPSSPITANLTGKRMAEVNKPAARLAARLQEDGLQDTAPHVLICARAGTGKTTVLIEGLKHMRGLPTLITPSPQQAKIWEAMSLGSPPKTIGIVAFNKAIAAELQRRVPPDVEACTMHSLGFRAVNKAFSRLKVESWRVQNLISEILEADIRQLRKDKPTLLRATEDLVGLCKQNLTNLEADCAGTISGGCTHPQGDCRGWEECLEALASHYNVDLNSSRKEVFELVPKVLERCKDPQRDGCLDFNDMIWLPVILGLAVPQYDLLLCDERQDFNSAQQHLVLKAGKRIVAVGDDRQCQPPGTMVSLAKKAGNRWHVAKPGNRVPIETLKPGMLLEGYCPKDAHTYSNRIVQEVQERSYSGPIVEVELLNGLKTRYTPNHKCYANFGPLRNCYAVYLMRRGEQYRVGSCQINCKGAGNGLVCRLRQEGGDASWILEVHETKYEARLREMEVSHQFHLPQLVFSNANTGYILDTEGADRFWDFVGNNSMTGKEAIDYYGLEADYPIALPGDQWQQSFKRPALFHACNLVTGMQLRTEEGMWVAASVTRGQYDGPVYSLKVSHDRLYMADGIVTHNSIMGFAGADADACNNFAAMLRDTGREVVELPLTVTRRCGRAIVAEANEYVQDFEAHETNDAGKVSTAWYKQTDDDGLLRTKPNGAPVDTYHAQVQDGDFILCRCNAPLVTQCLRFLRMGRRANIQGRDIGKGLITLIEKMHASTITELVQRLTDWQANELAKENAKRNPSETKIQGIDDRVSCLLCFTEEAGSMEVMVRKIESLFTDDKNGLGIRLSSIHKAKGLEADRVFLLQPKGAAVIWARKDTKPWEMDQMKNLYYVAVTRARKELILVY